MEYLENMTLCMYGGMKVNDPRCNGSACASGRANSSAAAAIVIDVASSSTVRSTIYDQIQARSSSRQSYLRHAAGSCSSLLRHCSSRSLLTGSPRPEENVFFPVMASYIIAAYHRHRRAERYTPSTPGTQSVYTRGNQTAATSHRRASILLVHCNSC